MRVPGLAAIAVGLCGLAAVMASTTPAPSGPVRSPVSASPRSSLADVAVRPGVQQAGRVQASPPTTADSEKAYKVACDQPARIQQAYDRPGTTIVGELASAVGR